MTHLAIVTPERGRQNAAAISEFEARAAAEWGDVTLHTAETCVVGLAHDLPQYSYDEVIQLIDQLTTLIPKRLTGDHRIVWSWAAYCATRKGSCHQTGRWESAFEALVHLLLSKCANPPVHPLRDDREGSPDSRLKRRLAFNAQHGDPVMAFAEARALYVNRHAIQALERRWSLAAPLAFALIEGAVRRTLPAYLAEDGSVRAEFEIRDKKYGPPGSRRQSRLNDITHGLDLLRRELVNVDPTVGNCLDALGRAASRTDRQQRDGFFAIGRWRNAMLHGEDFNEINISVLMNILSVAAIHGLGRDAYPRLPVGRLSPDPYDNLWCGMWPPDL